MKASDRIYRSSLRGVHKCNNCGHYNGNRARGCNNPDCTLYLIKKSSKAKHSIDPVQLISYNKSRIYSVQVKDRDPTHRNFVQITDTTLFDEGDSSIVSRNAICYVDTCKYDSNDISLSCKHIKCASESSKQAHEIKVLKDVLYKMKISCETKNSLWDLYSTNECLVPSVQRINRTTFVIICHRNSLFPAGRLHLMVTPDDETNFTYNCACKKLKILVSPNKSIMLQNDVCDHILLLLAGILSSNNLKGQFQNLLNAFCSYWIKSNFIFNDNFLGNEDFSNFSDEILNSVVEYDPDKCLVTNILQRDPNMTSESVIPEEENAIMGISSINENSTSQYAEYLELKDCQIELMDQFKLTNQIDLSTDDIQLCESELFESNNITCDINGCPDQLLINYNEIEENPPDNNEVKTIKKRKCDKPLDNIEVTPQSLYMTSPNLEFNSWLTFVIEQINLSIDFNLENPEIKHTFSIRNDFFSYLSERFVMGERKRIPNSTVILKKGRYKGLMKSTWIFTTIASIKRIFTSPDLTIELERNFVEKSPGVYTPYEYDSQLNSNRKNQKQKKILPTMYTAFVNLSIKNPGKNKGFVIEWTPNVYLQSKFGILNLEFMIGHKKNNKILDMLKG